MAKKKIIIVGSGIGGLSAGCFALMNGFDVTIFESHNKAGGLCTSWKRKGYTFDGSIHHLAGLSPDSKFGKLWEQLKVFPNPLFFYSEMVSVETPDGKALYISHDLEKLEKYLKEISPEDKKVIDEYLSIINKIKKIDILEIGLWKIGDFIKNFFNFMQITKFMKVGMKDFADRFKNPFLKKTFRFIQYDWEDIPLPVHANFMANCVRKNYGWYMGGSMEFSNKIKNHFMELGGNIKYDSEVIKILADDDSVNGVRLKDGTEYNSDYVISNSYGYHTIFHLLGGKYISKKQEDFYSQPSDEAKMGIHVSFGIKRDISKEPHAIIIFLDNEVKIADRTRERISIELFGFDKTFAGDGKGVLKVIYDTSFSFWRNLYQDEKKYREEKNQVARKTLDLLEKRFPGITGQVEVIDVATPITTQRYTFNAESYGSQLKMSFKDLLDSLLSKPKTLPKLKNFYMVGQSVGGSGIPGCALMGRNAVRAICKKEKIKFN